MTWMRVWALAFLMTACGNQQFEAPARTTTPTPNGSTDQTTADANVQNQNDPNSAVVPSPETSAEVEREGEPEPTPARRWKVVLATGDDSIQAFDNARVKVGQLIGERGVRSDEIKHLSMDARKQVGGVVAMNAGNLEKSLGDLQTSEEDGCMVFMTSHGTRQGFFLARQPILSPTAFGAMLDRTCGDKPTVVLISACYSGVFIDPAVAKDNRIILTAARKDRTSFGCGVENEYTFWDTCLVQEMPKSNNWKDLYGRITACVEKKESGFTPSLPQAHFGAKVENLGIFN